MGRRSRHGAVEADERTLAPRLVQLQLEHPAEVSEIAVGGENREIASKRGGAEQKVGVGALNAALATAVERARGVLVVARLEQQVRKGLQVLSEELELSPVFDSGEELLPDRAEQDHATFFDQFRKLADGFVVDAFCASKGERPHRRVDDDVQARRRCFL